MMRRLEIVYANAAVVDIRQGGLFEDFSPVREQWARMSGGQWTASVRAFFEAVAEQHRMPMDPDKMLASIDDFRSTWPACIAVKAAELEGPRIVGAIKKDGREVQFDDSSDGGSAASTLKGDTLVAHVNGTMVSIPTQEVDEVLIEEVYHDKMATYFWLGAGAAAVAWSVWFVLTWGPGN